MSKKMRPLYTAQQFKDALIHVLEKDYYDFIKSNPERANRAMIKIFMERLEDVPKFQEDAEIIRHVTQVMQEEGVYKFKGD